jgi:hypothetical protein
MKWSLCEKAIGDLAGKNDVQVAVFPKAILRPTDVLNWIK